jgi:hypothetical protein
MEYLSYLLPVAAIVAFFFLMRRRGAGMGGCCGMGHGEETHEKHHPQTKREGGEGAPSESSVLVGRGQGDETRPEKVGRS